MLEKTRSSVEAVWGITLTGLPVVFLVFGFALVITGYLQTDPKLLFAGSVILASGAFAAILKSVIIASEASQWRGWLEDYRAGMIVTAVIAPGLVTAITLVISIRHWLGMSNGRALLLGVVGGLIGWLICAAIAKIFVAIHSANPAVYRNLCSRFQILEAQMNEVEKRLASRSEDPIVYALAEVKKYRSLLQEVLGGEKSTQNFSAQDWIGASGYIRLWELLHRAEEALILLAPLETVAADAWHDQLRLEGSNIDNRHALLQCLEKNLALLRRKVPLEDPAAQPNPTDQQVPAQSNLSDQQVPAVREMLRYVRRSINEFRDERRFGLVQARNRLLKTVVLTECIGFALAALAVIANATDISLTAATAFFLVGAVVGLFNQLYLDASTETATDDYGLSTARLLHTPLFSGLAALGGVLIIPLLTSGVHGAPASLSLATVFDLTKTPFSFVLAAIFGLTPTVLISRLQQEAEQYKADLKGSDSLNRGPVVSSNAPSS